MFIIDLMTVSHLFTLNENVGDKIARAIAEAIAGILTLRTHPLVGVSTADQVEKMLSEVAKMEDLHHPNLMPLIGVCISVDHGMSIVIPYMANGSLLGFLKRERDQFYLDKRAAEDHVSYSFQPGSQ